MNGTVMPEYSRRRDLLRIDAAIRAREFPEALPLEFSIEPKDACRAGLSSTGPF